MTIDNAKYGTSPKRRILSVYFTEEQYQRLQDEACLENKKITQLIRERALQNNVLRLG